MQAVQVLLPRPLKGAVDYRIPEGMVLAPGDLVRVPLQQSFKTGVVWGEPYPLAPDLLAEGAVSRLKWVEQRLDVPPLGADLRRLVDWVADYYLEPPGAVLAMALRIDFSAAPSERWLYRAAPGFAGRLTPARQKILAALGEAKLSAAAIAELAQVGVGTVKTLAEAGGLLAVHAPLFAPPEADHPGPVLSAAQAKAAAALSAAVSARAFSVTLLQGVTGSGKTETYFEAIATALREGRQVLVLLPEIALTAQWLARFAHRFGVAPAVWHSDLGPGARRDCWHAVALGEAQVVVGARSGLFLPFADLGLIVVDEEHESSFKQEEGTIYHARDAAVVRAQIIGAPVVLASATPSLETVANVEWGRYRHLDLPDRHGGALMPSVECVDLRESPPERGYFLSPPVVAAVRERLAAGEQVLLFLNRRGYAPLTLCRRCGHRMQCKSCSAWLVQHRGRHRLICHHCGHSGPSPSQCPECGAPDALTAIGPGVERIAEEAEILFPTARRLVMASDVIGSAAETRAAIEAIEQREVDVIIGTQMVAKGWHFPHLTLVVVVDADLGLAGGDLRAGERTLQLLHQVAGRAGRASAPGRVILQSYSPEHPVIEALVAGDIDGFMATEAAMRRPGHWPPFGRLAALIVSSESEMDAERIARTLAREAPRQEGVEVLGPAPAPLALLRGRHRRRLLIKAARGIRLQGILRDWLARVALPRHVRVAVDVDPVSFM